MSGAGRPTRVLFKAAGTLLLAATAWSAPLPPVFPGAVGFGVDTPAGRGGEIVRVTTLADSGPGSLREALEKTGPRVVVFDVSGVIRLKADLAIRPGHGLLTIAGQTAPAPGITLANGGIAVMAHDILIQHIAVRPGNRLLPVDNRDCIKLEPTPGNPVHHVVIDHVSASWAVDETMSTWGNNEAVHDVTISNSILSEPLVNGGHSKGSHAYGPLGGRNTSNFTLVGNLLAFALGRNPLIRDRTNGAQIANNLIYRPGVWGNSVIYIGDLELPPHAVSVMGNVVVRHPLPFDLEQTDETGKRAVRRYAPEDYRNTAIYVHKTVSAEAALYLHDNRFFDPQAKVWLPAHGDPWDPEIFHEGDIHPSKRLAADPYANSGGVAWQPRPSEEVESHLLATVGKQPAARDALDRALVEKVLTRTGSFRRQLAEGDEDPWAPADIQRRRALALPADPNADADGNGYTNLEEWLHQLAAGVEIDGQTWLAKELAAETFADGWKERWITEGNAAIQSGRGRLHVVTSTEPGKEPAATLWWREALPADVLIEFTAGVDPSAEKNAANLNVILGAREADGTAYQFGRSGRYPDYQSIPNYIFTLTGGFQDGWARVRKNPGFSILAENQATRSAPGEIYRVRIVKAGGRIRYWLNGRLVHDVTDATPLSGGHFALRTWTSQVWWSDLRISALTVAPAPR